MSRSFEQKASKSAGRDSGAVSGLNGSSPRSYERQWYAYEIRTWTAIATAEQT